MVGVESGSCELRSMPRRVLDRFDDVQKGADMTTCISENASTDWTNVTINAMPPRDPNDDEAEDEDEDAESDDDVEPAVVREPDE
jgi:hypothetical protein